MLPQFSQRIAVAGIVILQASQKQFNPDLIQIFNCSRFL